MKLPKDPENWMIHHAERAIAYAERLFEEYERRYDADQKEATDDLYLRFLHAKEEAVEVATVVGVRDLITQARNLG